MPKIIENIRDRAIEETRKILSEEGFRAMTMRRIADRLDISPATIYNYFPSKEHLAAITMLEDWQRMTGDFEGKLEGRSPEETVHGLFDLVREFALIYMRSWYEFESDGYSFPVRRRYHNLLVKQLGGYIRSTLSRSQAEAEPWLPTILAELVLRMGPDANCNWQEAEPAVRKMLG